MTRARIGVAAVVVALAAAGGCSEVDDVPREPISGTVNLDGQPLKIGTIQFLPEAAEAGVASGGTVVDGRFDVARAEGPGPGTYKVMIFSQGKIPKEPIELNNNEMPGAIQAKPAPRTGEIPIRYNFQTELTAVVKPGGPNSYDFDLKKK